MFFRRWLPALSLTLALACGPQPHPPSGYGRFPRMPPNLLARKPPMGWSSSSRFGCDIDERLVREMADALVATGLRDAGYEYLVIDDCWQAGRAPGGELLADSLAFPHGIRSLADHVHARGLKLGLSGSAGDRTCSDRPGSLDHEEQDAATYAAWGIDYLKQRWCHTDGLDPREQYARMHDALARAGRDIVLSICNAGEDQPWEWAPRSSNLWCTTPDIADDWNTLLRNLDESSRHAAVAGPGHWNDPGVLQVGGGGMTEDEYRTHFGLWAMMAAPLVMGNDLRAMGEATRRLLLNADLLAVNQDPAGIQGARQTELSGGVEVWSRPLATLGERAALLFNRAGSPVEVTLSWSDVGLAPGMAAVRDLWDGRDLGVLERYTAVVPPHGSVALRLSGQEPPPPNGVAFLSDIVLRHTASGLGPVERDASNGGAAAGDGRRLTLAGQTYEKGLGVHAESSVRVWLGGRCAIFFSDIGVDDEVGVGWGSVVFQVLLDGELFFDSGWMSAGEPPRNVELDISGKQEMELRVTGAGDTTTRDRADWASARLVCNG